MIGIIDYGLGNIQAFENIYRRLHIPVKRLKTVDDFTDLDKLILPGVGAFDHAMKSFNSSGMRQEVEELVLNKSMPVVGICVGMQMLAKTSEEGSEKGLGWIDAIVRRFDESKINFSTHLPHMGWNDVTDKMENPIFQRLGDKPKFYFLHSYYFECLNNADSIARAHYGIDFTCVANTKNIYGVQFHPEKSHDHGITLLENFALI